MLREPAASTRNSLLIAEEQPNPARISSAPTCPLCHSRTLKCFQLPHTAVFQCGSKRCRLQFASPQPDDESLRNTYEQLYYPVAENQKPVWENSDEYTVSQLLKAVGVASISPAGKRVLDYGCGTGTLLRVVSQLATEAVGIEQNAAARDTIHRAGFASSFKSLDDLLRNRPGCSFDLIFMIDVAEHLRCPWHDLAEIGRFLAPDGLLVLTTMNTNSLRAKLTGPKWRERRNPTHFFYFTPSSLELVLRESGFGSVSQLTPITEYGHHGTLRRALQRVLAGCGLQGELLFVAGKFSASAVRLSAASQRNR